MMLLPNKLDARSIPIENGYAEEEIPKAGKIRRSFGKSQIICQFRNYENSNWILKMRWK
jgi:hypothetical protein